MSKKNKKTEEINLSNMISVVEKNEALKEKLLHTIASEDKINNIMENTYKDSKEGNIKYFIEVLKYFLYVCIVYIIILSALEERKCIKNKLKLRSYDRENVAQNQENLRKEVKEALDFQDANMFSSIIMVDTSDGTEKLFNDLWRKINIVESTDKKAVRDILDPSSFSYLLTGPPGTGKTLSSKYLAAKIDKELKLRRLLRSRFISNNLMLNIIYGNMLEDLYRKLKTRVKYIYVSPSMIKQKYTGESENVIKNIFVQSRALLKKGKADVVIVMLDESESIFKSRARMSPIHSESSSGITSELLAHLSSMPPEGYDNLFVIGATNMKEIFDPAFLRRFGSQYVFEKPDKNERECFIRKFLLEADVEKNQIDILVSLMEGYSQADISAVLNGNAVLKKSFDGKTVGFDYKTALKNINDRNKDLRKTEEKNRRNREYLEELESPILAFGRNMKRRMVNASKNTYNKIKGMNAILNGYLKKTSETENKSVREKTLN